MEVLAIIPARGGSKGIPQKNIKLLGGKPLIQYSIDAAKNCKSIKKIVVSTEDPTIASIAKSLGADVPFLRPQHLAEDTTPTLPVIQHALNFYESKGEVFDCICLLQATHPFRESSEIEKAIEVFKLSNADSLISVIPVPHEYNPHWTFLAEPNTNLLKIATGEKEIIKRRQDLPAAYHRDGSIYITKSKVLMEQNSLYGNSISYYISDSSKYVNIDTPKDWEKAERLLTILSNEKK